MPTLIHPLLRMIGNATHQELARQVQYLKVENEILRSRLPKRITVSPGERVRMLKYGKQVGTKIRELISIVSPRTFMRWVKAERDLPATPKKKIGRPRTKAEIRDLIIKIATETGWGYTRILGELKKLGIRSVSRTTVLNILKEAGIDPDPNRGNGSWDKFLRRHAETLWACDFIAVKSWTNRGLVDLYLLFFIHVESRKVVMCNATAHPDGQWVTQQAKNFLMDAEERGMGVTHLVRDKDTKFACKFDQTLESASVAIHAVGPKKPNVNDHASRCTSWMGFGRTLAA